MKNAKSVNQYLADLALWNIKLHNLHFNVEGIPFKAIHEFLEEIYDEAFEYYDAVAELMKQQGELPVVTAKEYLKIAGIKEIESKSYAVKETLEILLSDLELMRDEALKIREEADKEDNFLLANMMEDHVEFYALKIWFTRAFLAK
ncbi:MAG: DNA starvation/stationary phase protection protein [Negativicoccus succinicivorans]|uniref:Dps family protein n=1 Tax=Negativicoccus succinicivorans TaxID=620903 RepID=UPI0007640266|nr:DNA starvation/stationary phase protection protein [Negativicoccus succinicivorans]KWZ83051.1 ferritin-like protein [Anaerococcus hydrogenalis]MDU5915678.1 DNA starvation/stationary phase protection protein [Negativicoccus succinicivorans]